MPTVPCTSGILLGFSREMSLPNITGRQGITYILSPAATAMERLWESGQKKREKAPRKSVIFITKNLKKVSKN